MHTRSALIAMALFAVLAAVPPRSVEAGQIKVSPIRLDLDLGNPVGVLTVSNPGAEPMLLHLQVRAWDHVTGSDRYLDTRDVLLNPLIFRLQPGQQQLVRLGLMQPLDNDRERAYRLFIREVPERSRQEKRRITTVLNLSLPVFVAPQGAGAPLLAWRLEQTSATGLTLWAENRGNLHAEVYSITLLRQSGDPMITVDRHVYVLPGESRRWELAGSLAAPDELVTLTASSRSGPLQTALRPSPGGTVGGTLR